MFAHLEIGNTGEEPKLNLTNCYAGTDWGSEKKEALAQ